MVLDIGGGNEYGLWLMLAAVGFEHGKEYEQSFSLFHLNQVNEHMS